MQPSVGLADLYREICEAQSRGDHAFFEQCFSQQEGVLAIGTDPSEWWSGHDTTIQYHRLHPATSRRLCFSISQLKAAQGRLLPVVRPIATTGDAS